MTTSESLFECFVNVPHSVLGKGLRPLCLTHLLWLYHIGSPFVFTDRPVALVDLELAALICSSRGSEEILTAIDSKRQGLAEKCKQRLWRRRNRRADLKGETKSFLSYHDDHLALPRFHKDKDGGEANDAIPWLLIHAAALIRATGWAEETVFAMPVGKVVWLNLTFNYLKTGETSIVSDKEALAMRALEELTGGARKQ